MPVRAVLSASALLLSAVVTLSPAQSALGQSARARTVDQFVPHISSTPALAGQTVQLFIRERVQPESTPGDAPPDGTMVVFVHGATVPGEVAVDVPYEDYSWMDYLAEAGCDTFALDLTGYGRSTRPAAMDDPCNLPPEEQTLLIPKPLPGVCPPSHGVQLATFPAEWDQIDQVVEHIRALRHVDRVSFVGWSLGVPRVGGYAALYPEKVDGLVLLAPAYNRSAPSTPPAEFPEPGYARTSPAGRALMQPGTVRCSAPTSSIQVCATWSGRTCWDPIRSVRVGDPVFDERRAGPVGPGVSPGAGMRSARPPSRHPPC
jgi:pimeloyl-ACP methyl ester carboxylesterase